METNELLPLLAITTLGGFAVLAIGLLIYFLRKRRNREAAKRGFEKVAD